MESAAAIPEHVAAASDRRKRTAGLRHRRITRARVLDAAEKLFRDKGFHASSMQDIAAEAGYTTGALYSSFDGKDDLFLAVLERRRPLREQVYRDALRAVIGSADGAPNTDVPLAPDPAWYATLMEFTVRAAREPELRHVVPQVSGYSSRAAFFEEALKTVSASSPLAVERLGPIVWALVLGFSETWFAEPEAADPTLFSDAIAVLAGMGKAKGGTSAARDGDADSAARTSAASEVGGPQAHATARMELDEIERQRKEAPHEAE